MNEHKIKLFRVSAKEGSNIESMFEDLGKMIMEKYFRNEEEDEEILGKTLQF